MDTLLTTERHFSCEKDIRQPHFKYVKYILFFIEMLLKWKDPDLQKANNQKKYLITITFKYSLNDVDTC